MFASPWSSSTSRWFKSLGEIHALPLNGLAARSVPQILDRQRLAVERHRQRRSLMCGRQKARAVCPHAGCMDADEARQILVLGAEAVADPRAHRRPHFGEDAGVKLVRRAGVLRVVGVHAAQQADVIRDARQVRQQIGDHHARLAARPHRSHRSQRENFSVPTCVTSFRSGESIFCPCLSRMNVSDRTGPCCDGPPAMKRKITRFAFGMMPGMRAADGLLAARTMSASASPPNPQAADRSIWRRENRV